MLHGGYSVRRQVTSFLRLETGQPAKSVRKEWARVRKSVGLHGFHLADLHYEAASRFEECGVPTL